MAEPQSPTGRTMVELKHRFIETNGIRMHIAECGSGPLVLLCHGFPESWYSWRHQLQALAEAGFRAVAPDMRGYGQTDRPEAIEQYTLLHLVGDMVGLLDALGADTAVIAGHDWGAPVAWHSALLRPDRFSEVIGLSVPFWPRSPVRPTSLMPQTDDALFYQLYFQTPGVAEMELERDVSRSIRTLLYSASGDSPRRENAAASGQQVGMVPREGGFLSRMAEPASLPPWLTEADVAYYVEEFTRTGFRGGLNCSRVAATGRSRNAPLRSTKRCSTFFGGYKASKARLITLQRAELHFSEEFTRTYPRASQIIFSARGVASPDMSG
jgi:pimeloyl-ACP methyl ester carboxylesterase